MHRIRIAGLIAAAFLVASAYSAAAYVTPGPIFRASGYAYFAGGSDRAAIGDLNGDGLDDLVLGENQGVAVALATGGGSLGAFQHILPSLTSTDPEVGDFDGDGRLDVAGTTDDAVFVIYGDGNGGWLDSWTLPVAGLASPLTWSASGDLDGDGRTDLVAAGSDLSLTVYLGRADRTLGAAGSAATLGNIVGATAIAIGDVVGSSAPDIVVACDGQTSLAVYPGLGDGTLGARIDVPVGQPAFSVAIGALDAGGPLDLLVQTSTNASGVAFGSNLGGGAFTAFSSLPSPAGGFDVLAGDYNHDGKLDAVSYAFSSSSRGVRTWLGDGAGGFGPRIDSGNVMYALFNAVQSDVDGDGNLDIGGFTPTFYEYILIPGNSDGTFGGPPSPAPVAGRIRGGAAGDFDGDGKLDAVGCNDISLKLAFARGRGDGTFDPIVESAAGTHTYGFLASGRFDSDAALDLVAVDGSTPALSFLRGHGDGTFDAPVDFALGSTPNQPLIVDLNGDGKLDVVVPCKGANSLSVFLQGPSGLLAPTSSATPAGPVDVGYADLNGDGRLDRVLACTNLVVAQIDDGAGGYTTTLSLAQSPTPSDVELGDLDEDGRLDLVWNEANPNPGPPASPILHVLRGRAGGTFDTESTVNTDWEASPASASVRSLARIRAVDLDEDGHLDLVGGDQRLLHYHALRGHGDATFGPAESDLGSWLRLFTDYGDFNGDGHLDLLTGGAVSNQSSFTVFLNRTGGVTAAPPSAQRPSAAIALRAPYPNPARAAFTLRLSAPSADPIVVDMISVGGRRVLSRRIDPVAAGDQSLRLEGLSELSPGVYAVRVSQGVNKASTRVVVLP